MRFQNDRQANPTKASQPSDPLNSCKGVPRRLLFNGTCEIPRAGPRHGVAACSPRREVSSIVAGVVDGVVDDIYVAFGVVDVAMSWWGGGFYARPHGGGSLRQRHGPLAAREGVDHDVVAAVDLGAPPLRRDVRSGEGNTR
jgi:hypothetical protein